VTTCILITGCSGGGKSTLLAELASRGCATVSEPGRRIVSEERRGKGTALPWVDAAAFAARAVEMARQDLLYASSLAGPVFFDRGLIDAAVALHQASGVLVKATMGPVRPYAKTVLVAPPWPEIFVQNAGRRHDFFAALDEYNRLIAALSALDHNICLLPKLAPRARADAVLSILKDQQRG